MLLFLGAFYFVLMTFGQDPEDSALLTIYSSFLASMLSLFAIVFAFMSYRNETDSSESYRKKYIREDRKKIRGRI